MNGVILIALLRAATSMTETATTASAHLERGLEYFGEHAYERAIEEFRSGYAIQALPELLYAWAQAERLAGFCDRAVALYRRFLEQHPTERQAIAAKENIARCQGSPFLEEPPPLSSPTEPFQNQRRAEHVRALWYTDGVGDALAIAGVVALGAGATLAVSGYAKGSAASMDATYDAYVDRLDGARTRVMIGWIAVVIGALALGAAALRYASFDG